MGIGSGSTIVYAVQRLGNCEKFKWILFLLIKVIFSAERVKDEHLDIVCIPSSFQVDWVKFFVKINSFNSKD